MTNKYLSDFQIIGTSIKSLKIRNDFIILGNGSNFKRKIDISHSIISLDYIEDSNVLSGVMVLNIKVTIAEGKKKYSIDLSIEGCFNAPSIMEKETFREMLQVNGVTSLYSIARGFVQSTTSQTLITGNVLLPMFNVAAYSKDLDSEKNSN